MQPYSSPTKRIVIQQESLPQQHSRLSWQTIQSDVLLAGENQINTLKNIRNSVLAIRRQFQSSNDPKIHLNPLNRDDFNKRMILLENEVEGLMKRKINFSTFDNKNGQRTLDYTNLLNQKQNQVVQLQKKIQNLQFRLRKASARQIQLQNHIVFLNNQLRIKQQIIHGKNQIILAQVASSNAIKDALNKIRRNVQNNKYRVQDLDKIVFSQVNIPDIGSFEIRSETLTKIGALSRSRSYTDQTPSQQHRTRIVQLFREVQRILSAQNGQISDIQFERALQGYLISSKQSRIYQKSTIASKRTNIEQKYHKLRQNFAIAAGIYNQNIQRLRRDNPTIKINLQRNLFQILQRQNVKAYQIQSGAVFIDAYTQKTVQVPVQDARTKHLIHLLATQMKKFTTKYPQLLKQMDKQLLEFFQQQIIDIIEVDQIDKLVNIIKYVPQIVKVENVYAYSSEKTRKVQFHLRVLIKALLEELNKIKMRTGVVLEMDEGVIGMIRAEIMGVVNVDDILKVFRPVPKIVQVQKIVQKIVQRRVEVPMVVPITKQIQKIVQIQKIKQVQRIVNVPLQIPIVQTQIIQTIVPVQTIIQRVVEVPTIVERIVYVTKQVPQVVQVIRQVQKIVQVQKIIEVERVVNHIQQKVQQVFIQKQKIVAVQKIVQKIVEVPVIKQKIVQRIVQVPKVEIIQRIVQKAVPIIQYRKALQVSNHIQTIHKPVDRIVQKIVPVTKIVQRIVQVPQIIQKIVQVQVQKIEVREVQVIRQKLVREEVIKPVEVIVKQIVQVIRQVPYEVEKIIEIPVVQQVVKKVQIIVEKPIIQKIQHMVVKQVYLRQPMIIYEPKLVEVQKIVNHYIEVPKPIRYIQQKIVQIPRNVDRIKQVRVQIDKIVQKMVQVPKVVQVERIVQKIVIVPRVIQKVVEVPQIVQKIVIKQVEKIVVKQVQRIVQIPVIQQKIIQVQIIKNVYLEIQKPIDRVVDKLVVVNNTVQKIVTQDIKSQVLVEVVRQVPKTMHVDKIVPMYYQQIKPIQIQKVVLVPHQIAVPVQIIVEKPLIIRQIVQKIIQVPQFVQKIVQIKQQKLKIEYIERQIQKIVINQKIKQVQKIVPYIQQVIKQIPTIVQKIVSIQSKVQQIITATQIVQKIVERSTIVPRIYEIQKESTKLIKIPQIIQVQKIIPQIIRINQYIERIIQKIVEVPMIVQRIKQVEIQRQKIVTVHEIRSEIREFQKTIQKVVILEQMKQVIKNVNHVEKIINIVQKIQTIPVQVRIKQQILVQIPYIIEKIVQKIVLMPQIVQISKYIHQIAQNNQLFCVQNQRQFKQHEYKLIQLTKNMKPSLDSLIRQLRSLKNVSQVGQRIQVIQGFLAELQKFIAFPKLVRMKHDKRQEKIVVEPKQSEVIVVPYKDEDVLRKQLSMTILVEKLISQIKRIIGKTNVPLELDDQIRMIFFSELQISNRYTTQGDLKEKLNKFFLANQRELQSLGPWAQQNQLMVYSFLLSRFKFAQMVQDANLEIEKARRDYQNAMILLNSTTKSNKNCQQMLDKLKTIFRSYSSQRQSQLPEIKRFIEEVQQQQIQDIQLGGQQTRDISTQNMHSSVVIQNYQSKLRQKQATISKLKQVVSQIQRRQSVVSQSRISERNSSQYVKTLQSQINRLKTGKSMNDTRADLSNLEQYYKKDLQTLHQRNQTLERQNSQLKSALNNAERQLKVLELNGQYIMKKDEYNKISEHDWNMRRSGLYSESLSHSAIKRVDGSLSQSHYSSYNMQGGRKYQDVRQSPTVFYRREQQQPQQPGLMTPLQTNKFRSPDTTGMKFTRSFLKQESRSVTGQSPQQHHTIFTTPASIKNFNQNLSKQKLQQKQKQKSSQSQQSQSRIPTGYRYYYSPQQRKPSQ